MNAIKATMKITKTIKIVTAKNAAKVSGKVLAVLLQARDQQSHQGKTAVRFRHALLASAALGLMLSAYAQSYPRPQEAVEVLRARQRRQVRILPENFHQFSELERVLFFYYQANPEAQFFDRRLGSDNRQLAVPEGLEPTSSRQSLEASSATNNAADTTAATSGEASARSTVQAPEGQPSCDDFADWFEAQRFLVREQAFYLDPEGDGIACNALLEAAR